MSQEDIKMLEGESRKSSRYFNRRRYQERKRDSSNKYMY